MLQESLLYSENTDKIFRANEAYFHPLVILRPHQLFQTTLFVNRVSEYDTQDSEVCLPWIPGKPVQPFSFRPEEPAISESVSGFQPKLLL